MSETHEQNYNQETQSQVSLTDQTGTVQMPSNDVASEPATEPTNDYPLIACDPPGSIAGVHTHVYDDKGQGNVESKPKTFVGFFDEVSQRALDEAEKLGQKSPALLGGDALHDAGEAAIAFLENRIRILEQRVQHIFDTQHRGVL